MVDIRIGLPLPMDIVSTILMAIGKTYPGTVIKKDDDKGRFDRSMLLEIPDDERHNTPKSKKKYAKWKRELQKWDSDVTALGPDGVSVAPFEWLAKQWVVMAQKAFELEPGAVNYLESQVYAPNDGPYVFYVAKSDRQTPHELRKAAEEELAATRRQLEALTGHLNAIARATNIRTARTIVKQALELKDDSR